MQPWLRSLDDLRPLFVSRADDDLRLVVISRVLEEQDVPGRVRLVVPRPVDRPEWGIKFIQKITDAAEVIGLLESKRILPPGRTPDVAICPQDPSFPPDFLPEPGGIVSDLPIVFDLDWIHRRGTTIFFTRFVFYGKADYESFHYFWDRAGDAGLCIKAFFAGPIPATQFMWLSLVRDLAIRGVDQCPLRAGEHSNEWSEEYGPDRRRAVYTALPGSIFRASVQVIDALAFHVKPSFGRAPDDPPVGVAVQADRALDPSPALTPCQTDILRLVREHGLPMKRRGIIAELCPKGPQHGESTERGELPKLIEMGLLTGGEGRGSRGYGLPEMV